ncbi:MAG: hypothetical protein IT233_00440 [Bacteroidia bacterium]|nr:hypothetical protein [Bacteroidia bacterium]
MKNLFLATAFSAAFLFMGCGPGESDTPEIPVPDGMVAFDLSEYGMDVILNIPDSTNGISNHENVGDGVMLRVGNGYGMKVKVGAGEMEYVKTELIAKSEVYKLEKYVLEEPAAIIWRQYIEGQDTSARMFAFVKVGDVTYEMESDPDNKFSDDACKAMVESAKSLRAKPAVKPKE